MSFARCNDFPDYQFPIFDQEGVQSRDPIIDGTQDFIRSISNVDIHPRAME
jgi:hypothetical protein